MAYDKIVDSSVLDAGLSKVADAVRETTGTTEQMNFPDGIAENISKFDRIAQLQKKCLDMANSRGWGTYTFPSGATKVSGIYATNTADKAILEMPDTITTVPNWGLGLCKQFCPRRLSSSLTTIGEGGFCGCTNLAVTELPEGLTTIGNQAFQHCGQLAISKIPSSVTTIGNYAFQYCAGITLEEIPDNVTSLGYHGFGYCSNMNLKKLSENCPVLPDYLFYYCYRGVSITHIPACVTTIGRETFRNCSGMNYKNIYFDGTPTSIHSTAFQGIYELTFYVPWAEGAVANAPWGCSTAKIVYNYTGE